MGTQLLKSFSHHSPIASHGRCYFSRIRVQHQLFDYSHSGESETSMNFASNTLGIYSKGCKPTDVPYDSKPDDSKAMMTNVHVQVLQKHRLGSYSSSIFIEKSGSSGFIRWIPFLGFTASDSTASPMSILA